MEISELNANSVDPDQTPQNAASDLGLHCLPKSLLRGARLKWVNSKDGVQEEPQSQNIAYNDT